MNQTNSFFRSLLAAAVLMFAFAATATDAVAQDAISAERPGFSSSPWVLPSWGAQVESGYQYTRGDNFRDHTLPLTLVRVGMTDEVELQIAWAGYTRLDFPGGDVDGINDASIGVKWSLPDAIDNVPLALFAGVSIPIGDAPFTSDDADLTIGAFWAHSSSLDWFGTLLLSETNGDATLANAIGISLPIDERLGGYVEYFGEFGGGGGPSHTLNAGLAWLSTQDLQFDIYTGVGLNSRAPDFFAGLGLAYRF